MSQTLTFTRHQALNDQLNLAKNTFQSGGILVITGASGTGKSYLAAEIHHHGPSGNQPLIIQDGAGLVEGRFESQLFGHVKGAFSGASRDFTGLAGSAGRGTLCIEGIGDLTPGVQARMLRFIQERRYRPIGGLTEREFEGRLIFTSRQPLSVLLQEKKLREDFYYRIASSALHLPPLIERPNDFPSLCQALATDLAQLTGFEPLPSEQLNALQPGDVQGNLHGLRNLLQQAMIRKLAPTELVDKNEVQSIHRGLPHTGSLKTDLNQLEKQLLIRALRLYPTGRNDLAEYLGISRRALMYKLKQYGLN